MVWNGVFSPGANRRIRGGLGTLGTPPRSRCRHGKAARAYGRSMRELSGGVSHESQGWWLAVDSSSRQGGGPGGGRLPAAGRRNAFGHHRQQTGRGGADPGAEPATHSDRQPAGSDLRKGPGKPISSGKPRRYEDSSLEDSRRSLKQDRLPPMTTGHG